MDINELENTFTKRKQKNKKGFVLFPQLQAY